MYFLLAYRKRECGSSHMPDHRGVQQAFQTRGQKRESIECINPPPNLVILYRNHNVHCPSPWSK
jgi:hypothetical protein